jgi:hypothetical protein
LKTLAQQIKLDFGARRDVLVPRQHDNPSVHPQQEITERASDVREMGNIQSR